jgi:hypothetical protein
VEVDPNLWVDVILPSLLAALVTVAGGAITLAAAQARAWMRAKAMETENALLRGVLTIVADQAGIAVQHVAQTAVDKLKAASVDGKLTPAHAKEALRAAALETWFNLGKQAQELLKAEYGGFDQVMNQLIEPTVEAQVRTAKVTTPVVVQPMSETAALSELAMARQRLLVLAER